MKIGILTFQHANNFGAALQAFALVEYLNQHGHDAEIINYYSDFLAEKYKDKKMVSRRGNFNITSLLKMIFSKPMLRKRNIKFDDFRSNMRITDIEYTKTNIGKTNDIYDVFIAGSDQIWNHLLSNNDTTYMLDFVKDSNKKMSYASSFGLDKIEESLKPIYSKVLSDIKCMSVREETGKNIVCELIDRKPKVVLDPCLLLSKEEWMSKMHNERIIAKPYVLVYMFTGKNLNKILNETNIDISNYILVKINGNIAYKDFLNPKTKVMFGIGPKEFLNLFVNAELILTDSFHGTVFSVIFNKRFVTVLRELAGKNARIIDFLKPIGLADRIYDSSMDNKKIFELPNYTSVNIKLEERIKKSKEFIKDSLSMLEIKNVE